MLKADGPRTRRLGDFLPTEARMAMAAIGASEVLLPLRSVWAVDVTLLGILLFTPGWLTTRAMRLGRDHPANLIYVPCLSLLFVMTTGLVCDLLGLALGFNGLRLAPLAIAAGVGEGVLLAAALPAMRADRPATLFPRPSRGLVFLILPPLTAAGALLMNNGRGNTMAMIGTAIVGLALTAAIASSDRWNASFLPWLVYGASLALLWSFSLRGQLVYGFDISTEYHLAVGTLHAGIWHPDQHGSAYGAMLSLTVLPAALSVLSGAAPLLLLKVLYPALFALYPVGLFVLARRFVRPPYALVAAVVLVAQSYFYQQLPGIARQEMGLLFFAAFALALLDSDRAPRQRAGLIVTLGLGMVLTHYSTTYFVVAELVLFLAAQLLSSIVQRKLRFTWPILLASIIVIGGAGLWYSAITNSESNLTHFSDALEKQGPQLFPSSAPGQGLLARYLSGNAPTAVSAATFQQEADALYKRTLHGLHPLPEANEPQYTLQDANVDPHRSVPAVSDTNRLDTLITQFGYLLEVLGATLIGVRGWRRCDFPLMLLSQFALTTIVVIAFLRFSATAAQAYNQQRAVVQTLIPLGVCIAWLLQETISRLPRWIPTRLGALVPLIILLSTSGWLGELTESSGSANLDARGQDAERFVLQPGEVVAARWMNTHAAATVPLYTDAYGTLRLEAAAGRSQGVFDDISPGTLDRHAWIYERAANLQLGYAEASLPNAQYAVFKWPTYVNGFYDRVYTNGISAVYHR